MQKYAQHFASLLRLCPHARCCPGTGDAGALAHDAGPARSEPVLSPDMINNKLAAVRSIMVAAAEQGYLAGDTADAFRRVRGVSVKALKDRRSAHRRTQN